MRRFIFIKCLNFLATLCAASASMKIYSTKSTESLESSEKIVAKNPKSISFTRKLYTHLFKDYQHEIRPVLNDSLPITVAIQFWLKQILKVDERDQTLNVYCWLELYWTDELLTWDPKEYGGLDRIHVPSAKIWRPDILVYNNANMNVEENEMETNAIIKYNGEVTLFRAMITDIACTLSLSLFPFDQQICFLTFASWSMDGSKLLLHPLNSSTSLDLYVRNTEWELIDFASKMYEKMYECCPYPFQDITYFIALKRSPSYYIFSLIIPSAFITVVTIVGFFTPYSTTGENTEKVSTAVTALLSMTIIMMMISDEVPATSEVIPLIGKYYIGLIFIIFIAAFTTTITLALQMRGNCGARMSPRMRHILFERVAKSVLGSWIFSIQITDKRSVRRIHIPHQRRYFNDDDDKLRMSGSNHLNSAEIGASKCANHNDHNVNKRETLANEVAIDRNAINKRNSTFVVENNGFRQRRTGGSLISTSFTSNSSAAAETMSSAHCSHNHRRSVGGWRRPKFLHLNMARRFKIKSSPLFGAERVIQQNAGIENSGGGGGASPLINLSKIGSSISESNREYTERGNNTLKSTVGQANQCSTRVNMCPTKWTTCCGKCQAMERMTAMGGGSPSSPHVSAVCAATSMAVGHLERLEHHARLVDMDELLGWSTPPQIDATSFSIASLPRLSSINDDGGAATRRSCYDNAITSRWSTPYVNALEGVDRRRSTNMNTNEMTQKMDVKASVGELNTKTCALFRRLDECVQTIEDSMIEDHKQKYIEFEWEQGTRIIERMVMIFYVLLTLAFAFFMLGDTGDDVRLTETVMNRVKR